MLNLETSLSLKRARQAGADDIAMSCRVRLARNLERERFPDWASEEDRERVWEQVRAAMRAEASDYRAVNLDGLDEQARERYCEARLISRDLLARESGGGLIHAPDGSVCVMVNEEDHLRIQGFAPGLDLQAAWRMADDLDTRLDRHLTYAWDMRLGYLTACPSNVGTGLRAGAMLHLLGLRLLGEIDATLRGLERLRLLVRGISGEGSDAAGQFYQVSNMDALGRDEAAILARVWRICAEVVRQEHFARIRLIQEMPLALADCLARALSMLQHARLLATGEALEFLSALRLGASLGLYTRIKVADIDRLMLLIQPGHLQRILGAKLMAEERDRMRAEFLRRKVAHVKIRC